MYRCLNRNEVQLPWIVLIGLIQSAECHERMLLEVAYFFNTEINNNTTTVQIIFLLFVYFYFISQVSDNKMFCYLIKYREYLV
jgi:hypothetical protein